MNGYTPVVVFVVVVVATHTYTRRDAKLKMRDTYAATHGTHMGSFTGTEFLGWRVFLIISYYIHFPFSLGGLFVLIVRPILGGGTTFHFCIHALRISIYRLGGWKLG